MWRYCIQHQHLVSEYGFTKCKYSNIIGNTVGSRAYCEHRLLGAANLLCEATWSFPKIVFYLQMNLLCAATYINSLSASLLLNIFLSFEVGIAHANANFK